MWSGFVKGLSAALDLDGLPAIFYLFGDSCEGKGREDNGSEDEQETG
jgi:hypothetical protein